MIEPNVPCADHRAEPYVAGVLEAHEADDFERHLLACAACATLVIGLDRTRELVHADRPARIVTAERAWVPMALAASALVVITAGGVWWITHDRPLVEQAASSTPEAPRSLAGLAEFDPPPYIDLTSRSATVEESPFDAGVRAYNRREFTTAAALLETAAAGDPGRDVAQLFLGISLLASGRPADAVAPLRLVTNGDSAYAQLAALMLARAHLRMEQGDAARRALLRAQTGDDAVVSRDAAALLSRLAEQDEPRP